MKRDPQTTVREVIAENTLMTVASTDGDRPWVAPVQFCADDQLNLYFASLPTSRHAQHIAQNPRVGLAIFDSQQPMFSARGIQIDGVATKYSEEENPFATIGGLDMPENLQELVPGYVAYKVEPKHFYVPRAHIEGVFIDERLEVEMH